MSINKVLSIQEKRIEQEIKNHKRVYVTPNRATVLLERVKDSKPKIDIERGLYFTESFK